VTKMSSETTLEGSRRWFFAVFCQLHASNIWLKMVSRQLRQLQTVHMVILYRVYPSIPYTYTPYKVLKI
jgi:hypothetical protein